jgi:transposase
MLDARKETRVDVLQQACFLLQNEVSRQAGIVLRQAQRIAELEGRTLSQAELDLVLGKVEGKVAKAPPVPPRPAPPKPVQTGHGPKAQPALPRREQIFELPETERTCTVCEGQLQEMGVTEDGEEITVLSRRYEIVLNRRKKYRCRCNANVVTAPGPAKLIPGGRYSAAFAVEVAVAKYADHMPLERQAAAMAR